MKKLSRRGFIGALLAAPAIVKSENLMKLWVPRQDLVIASPFPNGFFSDFRVDSKPNGDFTMEFWTRPADVNVWQHIVKQRVNGHTILFVDGERK